MNSWYVYGIYLLFILIFFIAFIISLVRFIVSYIKNKQSKKKIVSFIASSVLLGCTIFFVLSHQTYYKYNDFWVKNRSITEVENRYGHFDISSYQKGEKGEVAYYIYTDNGPIMPDHADHYYYIEYDENGNVYDVYDAGPLGG